MSFVNCLHSVGLLLHSLRRRFLMPRVRPLHQLSLFIAIPIPFLDFDDKSVVPAFDLLQVIIGKIAPPLFQFTFELHPFPHELISVHRILLLCRIMLGPSHHVGSLSDSPQSLNPSGGARDHMDRNQHDSDQE